MTINYQEQKETLWLEVCEALEDYEIKSFTSCNGGRPKWDIMARPLSSELKKLFDHQVIKGSYRFTKPTQECFNGTLEEARQRFCNLENVIEILEGWKKVKGGYPYDYKVTKRSNIKPKLKKGLLVIHHR